jgi:hypothetical protein
MKLLIAALACSLLLMGCGDWNTYLRHNSSGHLGCPPGEIMIRDFRRDMGFSWTASCRGRVYYCSFVGNSSRCTPRASTAPRPNRSQTASRGGCQYDTQCKGDRVCRGSRCVDPQPHRGVERRAARPAPPARTPPVSGVRAADSGTFGGRVGVRLANASRHAASMGLPSSSGVVVLSVAPGSTAYRHRIRRGDVIVGLATARVRTMADVVRLNRALARGKAFHIVVWRGKKMYSFYMSF